MAVTTRKANVDDALAVATAHARGWQVAYKGIVPQEYLDAINIEQRLGQWRGYLEADTPTDYVAEVDGEVVGFANVGVFRDDPDDHAAGELWAMYVNPDAWGAGAGYALMQATLTHFAEKNLRTGYLWVIEQNDRARRFYERQGWTSNEAFKYEDVAGVTLTERRYSIDLSV